VEVQHLFYPRTLKVIGGLMLLNMQQNRAKMGRKQREKENEEREA